MLIKSGHRPRLVFGHVAEVDDEAVMGMGRAVVDFLTPDVGEYAFGVAGSLRSVAASQQIGD